MGIKPLEPRSVAAKPEEARPEDPATATPPLVALESILEEKPVPAELEDTADTTTGTD